MIKSTEKQTQNAILDYLALRKDLMYWRQNTGAIKTERGGFYRFTSMNGMPDIFVLSCAQIYALEVKDVKGKQNDNQIAFQKLFEAHGGIYKVVRSLDDIKSII